MADGDILHAMRNAIAIDARDDDTRLYLGPDRRGSLLEVVTVVAESGDEIAIHAMKMRRRYRRYLGGTP